MFENYRYMSSEWHIYLEKKHMNQLALRLVVKAEILGSVYLVRGGLPFGLIFLKFWRKS